MRLPKMTIRGLMIATAISAVVVAWHIDNVNWNFDWSGSPPTPFRCSR